MNTQSQAREALAEIEIYVVSANTDLTEGRGRDVPFAWTESRATAYRLAEKRGVMGSPATITREVAYRRGFNVYARVELTLPTKEDSAADKAREDRDAAATRAKAAGLSDEDIATLRGGRP